MARYKSLPRGGTKKKQDEFISAVDHAFHFIVEKKKLIGGLVIVALCVWLGIFYLNLKSEKDQHALNRELFKVHSDQDRIESYQKIINQFKGTKTLGLVRAELMQLYFQQGKMDEAMSESQQASKSLPPYLRSLLLVSQVESLRQQGQYADALKVIDDQQTSQKEVLSLYLKMLKASILASMGRVDEAKKIYEELSGQGDEWNGLQEEAQKRLVLLYLKS